MPKRLHFPDFVAAGAILVAASAMRLYFLTPDALTLDEATSVLIARLSPDEVLRALSKDGNPPVYYLLLHSWIRAFGDSEHSVRLLSVAFGALLPPLIYLVSASRFGRASACLGAGLALVAPLHVYYSHQVRMYSLLPLASLAFVSALVAAIERGGFARWAMFAVGAAAVPWTHNYGVFLLAVAPAAWWCLAAKRPATALPFSLSLCGAVALYAPWIPVLRLQTTSGVANFIQGAFEDSRALWMPPEAMLNLVAGYRYPDYLYSLGTAWSAPNLAIGWLLAVVVITLTVSPPPRDHVLRLRRALLVLTLGPLALAVLVSTLVKPVFLLGRYEIIVFPFFVLFLAIGLGSLYERRTLIARVVVLALMAVYLALAVPALRTYAGAPPNRIPERIANAIAERATSGDVVLTTGLVRAPVEYYLGRANVPVTVNSFPRAIEEHLGWYDPSAFLSELDRLAREAATLLDALPSSTTLFLVEHTASPSIQRINTILHTRLAERAAEQPTVVYTAGPNPNAPPVFLVARYRLR